MSFAKVGSEVFVNTTTAGNQYESAAIQLTNGDIVVAWTDVNGTAVNVRGQILNSDGVMKDGSEFMLNTTLSGDQFNVALTALGNGGFAAGWTSSADWPAGASVFELEDAGYQNHAVTQVFSSNGAKVRTEQTYLDADDRLYTYPDAISGSLIHTLILSMDNYVQRDLDSYVQDSLALTADISSNSDDFDLLAVEELYDEDHVLAPTVPWFYTNTLIGLNNILQISSNDSGVHQLNDPAEGSTGAWNESVSALSPGDAGFPELDRFHDPKAITLPGGTVVTAYWREANASNLGGVHVDIATETGTVRMGSDAGTSPGLAELSNGNIVVVWADTVNSSDGNKDIRGQIISADVTKIDGEFVVTNRSDSQWTPAVAALADGRFVVVWEDLSGTGGDASGSSIKGQIFSAAGVKSGTEFLVNSVTDDSQYAPTVTALADGNFIVTWTSADGATKDIKSQVFDPRVYAGDASDETVYGGSDDDHLDGRAGADVLYGNGGDDVFETVTPDDLADGDVFDGGAGIDTLDFDDYVYNWGGAPVLVGDNGTVTGVEVINLHGPTVGAGLNDIDIAIPFANSAEDGLLTVNGAQGQDFIHGNRINNNSVELHLNGGGGDDQLFGGAGADELDGGTGEDFMEGGYGLDHYFVDSAGDTVIEDSFFGGWDTVTASIDYTLGTYLEHLILDGTADLDGTGNEHANTIIGNAGNNVLVGGTGADTLRGLAGNDTYYVDNALDVVVEAVVQGTDNVNASVNYVLGANVSVEKLRTTDAAGVTAINLVGNELNNFVTGNDGTNFLVGGGGVDTLTGNGGNDSYLVDNAADVVIELAGEGIDNVNASVDFTLAAGVSSETLRTANAAGLDAIDLTGNEINNFVTGNAGANILNGGLGSDTLTGNGGTDTFVFNTVLNAATNVDTVVDFVVVDDTIRLENTIFTGLAAGALSATAFRIGAAAADADDRIIYDNNTGALRFDSDGNGANAATQFATLATGLALTNNDFVVI